MTYSTVFPNNENPLSEGGVWQNEDALQTPMKCTGGRAFGTQAGGGFDDSAAVLYGHSRDHEVRAKLYINPGLSGVSNRSAEILLRWSGKAAFRANPGGFGDTNTNGYEVELGYQGAYLNLGRFKAAGLVNLVSIGTPATGDDFIAQVVTRLDPNGADSGKRGQRIRCWWKGTKMFDFTDNDAGLWIQYGNPGIGAFIASGAVSTDFGLSNVFIDSIPPAPSLRPLQTFGLGIQGSPGPTSIPIPNPVPVRVGDVVEVFATLDGTGGTKSASVSDGLGNTYTSLGFKLDATNNQRIERLASVITVAGVAAITLKANPTPGTTAMGFAGLAGFVWGREDVAGAADGSNGAAVVNPGTGSDAISTGEFAMTNGPCVVSTACLADSTGTTTPVPGWEFIPGPIATDGTFLMLATAYKASRWPRDEYAGLWTAPAAHGTETYLALAGGLTMVERRPQQLVTPSRQQFPRSFLRSLR